jgi:hypothetical protein
MEGVAREYTSMVREALECPSRSDTTLGWMPAVCASVALLDYQAWG